LTQADGIKKEIIMRIFASLFVIVLALPVFGVDDGSAKITGSIAAPKALKSFDKLVLEVRLYEYDPRIADKAADLVDMLEVKDFSHTEGKETTETIELGAKAKIKPGMSYYITVFVLDGKDRTYIGDLAHAPNGFAKVLTNGEPREIRGTLRSVKK